jgi:hypothetical protein
MRIIPLNIIHNLIKETKNISLRENFQIKVNTPWLKWWYFSPRDYLLILWLVWKLSIRIYCNCTQFYNHFIKIQQHKNPFLAILFNEQRNYLVQLQISTYLKHSNYQFDFAFLFKKSAWIVSIYWFKEIHPCYVGVQCLPKKTPTYVF